MPHDTSAVQHMLPHAGGGCHSHHEEKKHEKHKEKKHKVIFISIRLISRNTRNTVVMEVEAVIVAAVEVINLRIA